MKKYVLILILALCNIAATVQRPVAIFLAGDSTMADKPLEKENRERGWGMYFAAFFNQELRVENHAVNGRSTKSFRTLGHWEAMMERVQQGDYVIIQFGHNDAKLDDTLRYAAADTDFRYNLQRYVEEVRSKGAKPLLYTSISRRKFDENGRVVDTHGRYLEVTRELALQLQVPLVDLYDSTANWLHRLGPEASFSMFMNLAPDESLCAPKGKEDNTHLNTESAPVVAKMAAEGLVKVCPELQQYFQYPTVIASEAKQSLAQALYYAPKQSKLAFPNAEGFGKYTVGGRGGRVIYVTNLNDSGTGSLREAVTAKGPRTVLFKVSGTIALKSQLDITENNITIAGQSAPGDGICITDETVNIKADNVIIRYMRFRMGDKNKRAEDAVSATWQKNIIIDHCSMSWSVDECASFYNNESFTLQWCLLSESLCNSAHTKGAHGYGGIWGGMGASFHHNLLAHHSSRNPRFSGARSHEETAETEWVDFRNNVIYNWGFNSSYGGESGRHNMVNNYYKPGPATSKQSRHRILDAWQSKDGKGFHDFGKFYLEGNVMEGNAAVIADNWKGVDYKIYQESIGIDQTYDSASSNYAQLEKMTRLDKPLAVIYTETEDAYRAYENVLKHAGASLVRDALDSRIVQEVRTGTFTYGRKGIIDSQTDTEGLPELKSLPAPLDSDDDGMPDEWEIARGLNPSDPSDGTAYTLDPAYTNLEVYLNSLIMNYE
ncbi:MAG: GDSL-type esterase/lipase family protein [Bacteroidales bacterium]|nr:GDSL-type esterase/lipase family protein [Bacteroidales bacterium]MCL2133536.1 GDSL-type esterase/lipase family protein [Bacteroidales bacterium]